MVRRQIRRLPGMRDVTPGVYERNLQAFNSLKGFLASGGYSVIDTPLLEESELFVRKSGGELASRLYTFTDPGGHRVSLRPEFTSSVIRYFIQERESLDVPIRWQYGGPVFRYEPGDLGGYHQLTQVGAELLGEPGVEADAEVICVAREGLEQAGLSGYLLRIGHMGVLYDLVSGCGLSEPAKLLILSNVPALKGGQADAPSLTRRAEDMGLLRANRGSQQKTLPEESSGQAVQESVQRILTDSMPPPMGRRTTEQIMERLLRKLQGADDAGKFKDAVSLVAQLAGLDGPPEPTLKKARDVAAAHGAPAGAFDSLARLFDLLDAHQSADSAVVLDLGLARGISYYTGVIFELTCASPTGPVSLGGGGRYDGLVRALGGEEDIPALGFAYNLDQVVDALDGSRSWGSLSSV